MATVDEKELQLRKHKRLATGLFVLMVFIYIITVILHKQSNAAWIGYVEAFSEAGMVGALADWFAVTALFHYPLGLHIPHTNLIQNSKERIGNNLGDFVVSNFLNDKNIRPYIEKISIASTVATWLGKEKNVQAFSNELIHILKDIVEKLDDDFVSTMIYKKGKSVVQDIDLNGILANAVKYFIDKSEHERLITFALGKIKMYVQENEDVVRARVKKESSILIPGFVDNLIANKLIKGINTYIDEIETDKKHPIRKELEQQLYLFEADLRSSEKWKNELDNLRNDLLANEKLDNYSKDIWAKIKASALEDLNAENSGIRQYIIKTIHEIGDNLSNDGELRSKIDKWIKYNAYNYILHNSQKVSGLISNTVGNWEGKELSNKLELEVGKDLQFIRINGTLVGGLVGLVIHILTVLLS